MTRPYQQLGDSHNFGRRVSLRDGRVAKPSAVLWEWLLLCGQSPLRRLLAECAASDGLGRDAFAFLPTLEFFPGDEPVGGEVEQVRLQPLEPLGAPEKRKLAQIVGRSLALFELAGRRRSALGEPGARSRRARPDRFRSARRRDDPGRSVVADRNEAAAGRRSRVRAGLPARGGVRRVLPYLGKPVAAPELLAMAGAYRGNARVSRAPRGSHRRRLWQAAGAAQTPARVLLRGTEEYVHARFDARCGRRCSRPSRSSWRAATFPTSFGSTASAAFTTTPIATLTQLDAAAAARRCTAARPDARRRARTALAVAHSSCASEGLFTLLGAFDHPSLRRHAASDELSVTFGRAARWSYVARRRASCILGAICARS